MNEAQWTHRLIADLLNTWRTGWDVGEGRNLFPYEAADAILEHVVRPSMKPDRVYWAPSKTEYTIKSNYLYINNCNARPKDNKFCKDVEDQVGFQNYACWKLSVWKAFHNALPLGSNRRVR